MDCSHWPRHQQFIWRGQGLRDKRVPIRCYHGLGDTIQFARFIPRVRAMAREVVLWTQPRLIPLLQTLRNGADSLLPLHDGTVNARYDVDLELFEVMHALRLTLDDLGDVPYLLPDEPVRRESIRACRWGSCGRPVTGMKIDPFHPECSRPSVRSKGSSSTCSARAGVLALEQRIWREAELQWHRERSATDARVDLLITVDTCSAHLAGALGVLVWTLLPQAADWRWMRDRTDTPWYPSMKPIRQPGAGRLGRGHGAGRE